MSCKCTLAVSTVVIIFSLPSLAYGIGERSKVVLIGSSFFVGPPNRKVYLKIPYLMSELN